MKVNKWSALLLALIAVGNAPYVRADSVKIVITGMVLLPTCVVNNGQTIQIDFGDIPLTNLTASQYQKVITVPVSCQNRAGYPFLKVIGSALSGADSNVLATSMTNLGIALYQGQGVSTKLTLGNGLSFNGSYTGYLVTNGLVNTNDTSALFTFTAALYKLGTASLSGGAFSASASMAITYL
ncbi:fimbrial protein [Pantoea sp. 1.19]|uniref:fimbrial protein n=1 Tax=Pantoea sp. 1.19 TaxID=1925589 RepID=UPI000948E6D1|nr:fimbrial protein [Pantoea sp. 1.19]